MAMWHFRNQTLPDSIASVAACHVRLRPGLVDKDQTPRINLALALLPLRSSARDVWAVLFAGVQAFF
jgi:hypothetical protein